MDLKNKIEPLLNREVVAEIIAFTGRDITKNFRFADNPSITITKKAKIFDYGSTNLNTDIYGYLMQEEGLSFPAALEFVSKCLGVQNDS